MFENLWQDLRGGMRNLVKSPGFTLVAILSLTIAANANSNGGLKTIDNPDGGSVGARVPDEGGQCARHFVIGLTSKRSETGAFPHKSCGTLLAVYKPSRYSGTASS